MGYAQVSAFLTVMYALLCSLSIIKTNCVFINFMLAFYYNYLSVNVHDTFVIKRCIIVSYLVGSSGYSILECTW